MTAKFDATILARLGDASPEELSAALAAIREDIPQHQGVRVTQDTVTAVQALAAAAAAIRDEQAARQELASNSAAALAELEALTTAEVETVEAEAATETDAATDEPEADDATGEDAPKDEDTAVTASGRRKLGGLNKAPKGAGTTLPVVRSTTRAAVASGKEGIGFGTDLDRRGLSHLLAETWENVRGLPAARTAQRHQVATVFTEYPEDRHLSRTADAFVNLDKVDKVASAARTLNAEDNAQALVAAGLCAPLQVLYDINTVGDIDRPVRDALVRFGADRGGITYRPPLSGVTQTGGIGVWTEAQDEAEPLVPKACAEIDCPGLLTAQVEAIYKCLTFSNMSTRFDPEFMDSVVRAQAVAHARIAENRLLTALVAGSTRIYSVEVLGAARDMVVALDKMAAYFRSVFRLNANAALRLILPSWARDLMRADIARQMVGDGLETLAIEDSRINEWFRRRNINVTWHLDGIDPANIPSPVIDIPNQIYPPLVADGVLPPFPNVVSALLFQEGDWLFLDGGTLDLGVVRDSTLNGLNRFQTFSESWEASAFRGLASFHMALQLNPTGQSAATQDTSALVD